MLVELPMVMECARRPLPTVPPLLLLLRMLRGVEGSPAGQQRQPLQGPFSRLGV
jgi:hypothetical protein